jgi:hypothetical protein
MKHRKIIVFYTEMWSKLLGFFSECMTCETGKHVYKLSSVICSKRRGQSAQCAGGQNVNNGPCCGFSMKYREFCEQ